MQRKFYVLVPIYKTEKYIDTCIRSVLEQGYDNFRLILVDDGTPDKAGEICDAYAAQDLRITVIHKENGGLISARRAAIGQMLREAGSEDFAIFLDSDDSLKPGALHVLNNTIETNNCDMVVYGMDRVFEGKVLSRYQPAKSFIGVIEEKRELYRLVFLASYYNALWRKAVSVKLLSDDDYSMYYRISQGEDLLQSIPLYGRCKKAVFIEDSLYNYTFNPNSITNTYRYETYKVNSIIRSKVTAFLEEENVWEKEDWDRYNAYCRGRIVEILSRIGSFDTGKENKIKLFRDVLDDPCYGKMLRTATPNDTVLHLLKEEKFSQLLRVLAWHNMLTQCKRRIKKILAR